MAETKRVYDSLRKEHAQKRESSVSLPIADARANRANIDWHSFEPPVPNQLGVFRLDDYPLSDLIEMIDWTPFFMAWELPGRYPDILEYKHLGAQARELFADAQALLAQIVDHKLLTAKAAYGLFPANAVGDDIELYDSAAAGKLLARLHHLRQQKKKDETQHNLCLSDFIAPKESGKRDYCGAFVVSVGFGADELAVSYQKQHDDYASIMVKVLADRLAESFAERLHQRIRTEFWGYAKGEQLSSADIVSEKYVGIRPAPGYPACPDHTEKATLWKLLDVEQATGIRLTESYAMYPAASVSGWYFSHPASRYFGVGRIDRDQVIDYAARKGMSQSEVETWLASNLAYEPAATMTATTAAKTKN